MAGLIGAVYAVAWVGGLMACRGISEITIKANTALGFFFSGLSLILLIFEPVSVWRRWISRILGATVLILGTLTFAENITGWNLGIDQLLAKEPLGVIAMVSPNRMGLPASLSFILFGAGLLSLSRTVRKILFHQYLALILLLINLLPTVGYFYGVRDLFGVAQYTGIAWPTALAFLGLGIGLLCSKPREGMMAVVSADDFGGMTVRWLLLPASLLPLILGYTRDAGQRLGLYNHEMGTALRTIGSMIIFSTLVYYTGRRLCRASVDQRTINLALRKSEAEANGHAMELAAVMETTPAMIFVSHDPECRHITCNQFARSFLRLSEHADSLSFTLEGEGSIPFHVVKDGRDLLPKELPMQKAAATGTAIHNAELTLIFKDGTCRHIFGEAVPLFDEDGKARGVVGAIRRYYRTKTGRSCFTKI